MYDSNYYRDQMNYYDNLIKTAKNEQKQYESLMSNLLNLNSCLPSVQTDLKDAENSFLNGGFISDNETFDKGMLKECCTNIDNILSDISGVISKINKKILELDNNITDYSNQYRIVSNSYNNALLKEQGD